MLTSPSVTAPLSPYSKFVFVEGQLPNSTVRVFATTLAGNQRVVAEQVVSSSRAEIKIANTPLHPQERITAQQFTSSDQSELVPPELGVEVWNDASGDDLGGLFCPETLLECGRALWVAGAEPGAEVTLDIAGEAPLVVEAITDSVQFNLRPGRGLSAADEIYVSQTVAGTTGATVPLPKPVTQTFSELGTPPPVIDEPLFRCQRSVFVESVVPGATVIFELDQQTYKVVFSARYGWLHLPRPFDLDDELKVRQIFELCERTSEFRHAFVTNKTPTPPSVIGPLCEGDRWVRLGGVVQGALVELALDDEPLCRGSGGQSMTFGVPSLIGGRALKARQSLCGDGSDDWSAWSDACPIRSLGSQPAPTIVQPLIDQGVAVGVRQAPRGTLLQIVGHRGVIGEDWSNGDERRDVRLWKSLQLGEKVRLRSLRCGNFLDHLQESEVEPLASELPPEVVDPACDCGGSVLVRNVIHGAIVEVFRVKSLEHQSGVLLGIASAGDDTVSVDVPALRSGEILRATQRIGWLLRTQLGDPAKAPGLPEWDYAPDSAFRLCQLTQDADPADRPHPGPTTQIQLYGTDLGVPVEHGGALHLFFGDSTRNFGTDPIAWSTTNDPDELQDYAPNLSWVTNSGKFQPLCIDGCGDGLGIWSVPTGGFSYGGDIWLFVAYPLPEGAEHMTGSLLARRKPGSWLFFIDQFVSNTVAQPHRVMDANGQLHFSPPYPTHPGDATYVDGPNGYILKAPPWRAGNWLLHVSPTVIRNSDWPGVPTSTGDGLLMFGSSSYRGAEPHAPGEEVNGNVYLAWAPLTQGAARPVPTADTWKFFVGARANGTPVWKTIGEMKQDPNYKAPKAIISPSPAPRILGELSAVWYPQLRRWILAGGNQGEINIARQPWGPWTPSKIICHVDMPDRDAGNLTVQWTTDKTAYAPYLIARWLRWDRSNRQMRLHFTLSGFDESDDKPKYQPQLICSTITCNPPF